MVVTKTLEDWVGGVQNANELSKTTNAVAKNAKQAAKASLVLMKTNQIQNRQSNALIRGVKASSVKMDETTEALTASLTSMKNLSNLVVVNNQRTESLVKSLQNNINDKKLDVDEMHREIQLRIRSFMDEGLAMLSEEREFFHNNSLSRKMDVAIVTKLDKHGVKIDRFHSIGASVSGLIAGLAAGFLGGKKVFKSKST